MTKWPDTKFKVLLMFKSEGIVNEVPPVTLTFSSFKFCPSEVKSKEGLPLVVLTCKVESVVPFNLPPLEPFTVSFNVKVLLSPIENDPLFK
ncbi:hypothetical protein AQAU111925_06780 [Aquirufa aurantiipilula]